MDAILMGFLVVTLLSAVVAVAASWSGRPWTASMLAVVALLAATPLARFLPEPVVVAALVILVMVAGAVVWPRRRAADDRARDRRGALRGGRGSAP